MPSGQQWCLSVRMRSLNVTEWAWVALGGTSKAQSGLKGELQLLKNLTLSAQWVTKCIINCVVLSLHGQLCPLKVPSAITGSSGISLKAENHASLQWLELLQAKWVTDVQEPPLKIARDYSIYLKQIYEKCVPRTSLHPESELGCNNDHLHGPNSVLCSWIISLHGLIISWSM